jgi:MGT family glycosyltransferase
VSRFLFVVPPLTGHVTPLVAVARRLADTGHAVLWSGAPSVIRPLAGPEAVVDPCPEFRPRPAVPRTARHGYAAVQYLWENVLIPLADTCVDSVTGTARRFHADVVVADMQALAGPLAAVRLGLPWATSATTSASLRDSFINTPKIRHWRDGLVAGLIDRHCGTVPHRPLPRDLEMSPDLVIAFTTTALTGDITTAPQIRFVGPALCERAQEPPFPTELLDGRPLVVTALGTLNGAVGGRFLTVCAEACLSLGDRVQAAIADPTGVLHGASPPDVITRPHLPMLPLLRRASVVICHAGHNTVCESLAHGVPLIVAPVRDDQPVVASQVTEAGAGIRVRFGQAGADTIRRAVLSLLDEPDFAASARAIKESFGSAGSAAAAADHLVALARGRAATGGA